MYVCIHVQYTYVYAFAKFFFYYEYSTIVFDLAIIWNLINDIFMSFVCVFVCVGGSEVFLFFFFLFFFFWRHGLINCETCRV